MAKYYDPDRVERIKEIMPRFVAHARPRDRILMGLRGDSLWPAEYDSHRPSAEIIKVKNVGSEDATLRVRTDKGAVLDIPAANIHPKRVWEFSDDSFEKVLARTKPMASTGAAASYRGSSVDDGFNDLRSKVEQLSSRLDQEMRDARSFNGALIQSFSELCGEMSRGSSDKMPFASTFSNEYRSMIKDGGGLPDKGPSPFDSDFSDSDVE